MMNQLGSIVNTNLVLYDSAMRTDPQMKIRLPEEVHSEVARTAKLNKRSMNAEIVHRLQNSGSTVPQSLFLETQLLTRQLDLCYLAKAMTELQKQIPDEVITPELKATLRSILRVTRRFALSDAAEDELTKRHQDKLTEVLFDIQARTSPKEAE